MATTPHQSPDPKSFAAGCGLLVAVGLLFGIWSAVRSPSTGDGEEALPASASCETERVVIENLSRDIWEDARIEINGTWEYKPGVIVPGRQPYLAGLFTKPDGTRLNLLSVACQRISIHATVKGKRRHWNGAR